MEIIIRELEFDEVFQAYAIYVQSWKCDYNHFASQEFIARLDIEKGTADYQDWLYEDCDDLRLMYGAFVEGRLVGYIAASLADACDAPYEAEINSLHILKDYRGLGIGLKLMYVIGQIFLEQGYSSLVLYNWRLLASNGYYRGLDAVVVREDIQQLEGQQMVTDIFGWQLGELLAVLEGRLGMY